MPDTAPAKSGQLFTTTNPTLRYIVDSITHGQIGLPDLQRPFVWRDKQVRDLFDSLYRGYPVGHLLLWETGADGSLKAIGAGERQAAPKLAIVDGQQRLTSLFAVMEGSEVLRKGNVREAIRIAFNPLTAEFKVADAAVKNDPAFIPDISRILTANANLFSEVGTWTTRIQAARELSTEEIERGQRAIQRLSQIASYVFTVVQLPSTASPEVISDIFVRINSKGAKLNQADFLLTMMSVYWDEGRKELEDFCARASSGTKAPANPYIKPPPEYMLRVSVGLGFGRAKLSAMHAVLRGHTASDLGTGAVDQATVDAQFRIMAGSQAKTLDINHWTAFQKCLLTAGYRSSRLISSNISIIATYLQWLIGRCKYEIPEADLRMPIARWFFMAALTGRYTASFESQLERELKLLAEAKTPQDWLSRLDLFCDQALTSDLWKVTLPNALATSASRSPAKFAFFAAQNLLGATALYSNLKISDLLDPAFGGSRSAMEWHHLFPRAHLDAIGIQDQGDRNQIANFTLAEWLDNSEIAAKSPQIYAPEMMAGFSSNEISTMHHHHALPDKWWLLPYPEFLKIRRELMSGIIQEAYLRLCGHKPAAPEPPTVEELIKGGEDELVEYKSTLRVSLHTGNTDEKVTLSALKSIAGFMNAQGGTLVIGIADDGSALGLEADGFPNEDKMALHLVNLVKARLGADAMPFIHPKFEDVNEGRRALTIKCDRGHRAVFVKDGQETRFYVRSGPSTAELQGADQLAYIKARFG